MKVCPNCGMQNQDQYGFCIRCGSPLNVQAPAAPQTAPAYQAGSYYAGGYNDVGYTEQAGASGSYAFNAGGYNAGGYNDVGYTEQPGADNGGYAGNTGGYFEDTGTGSDDADGSTAELSWRFSDGSYGNDVGGYNGGYAPGAGSGGYDSGAYVASGEWDMQPKQQDDSNRNSRIAIIVAIAALVLCLVIGAIYWFFLRGDDSDSDTDQESSTTVSQESRPGESPYSTTWSISTTAPTSTSTTTIPSTSTTTLPSTSTTTYVQPGLSIPADLLQYSAGLVPENRMYKIQLKEDDWNIIKRSTPHLPTDNEPSNKLGKLPSGTQVYVEYIYNGTWAVCSENGSYYFLSLYAANDPSQSRLMNPVD